MTSFIYRTRGMLQFPRYVPTLVVRSQSNPSNPKTSTPGQGVPMSGSTKTTSQTGGTKKGDSSVLPPSATSSDSTNPTKTSSDAPSLDHENVDLKNKNTNKQNQTKSSSSSGDSNKQQSFFSTPVAQIGMIGVLAGSIYAGYRMMSGGGSGDKNDLKKNENYKRAVADYQAANTQGTDVKK